MAALRSYPAVAISTLALVVFSGFGLAANAAVPGDLLYGLDVAMEKVGIGAGSLPERISEAQILSDRGNHAEALDHLAASISNAGDQAEPEDLTRAIEALDEYVRILEGTGGPDNVAPPANESSGPGNNASNNSNAGTNPNTGPGNNASNNSNAGTNPNTGPGNNASNNSNAGTNPNTGPGNIPSDNPDKGEH